MSLLDDVNGTLCDAQQYQQSLTTPDNPNPLVTCLTHTETAGMTLATAAGFLSIVAIFSVFVWIGRNIRWYKKNVPKHDWRLFDRPFDIYMAAILWFDIWQAMGGIVNVRWVGNGIVATGPYCTAQGIIQQFGELGVAMSVLILAVHTFVSALWRVGLKSRRFALGLVFLVFCYCTLWVSIGASTQKNYEIPTPFWCWISPRYPGQRLAGEYLFLWLALFISVLLYIPLYYWTEGRLSVDEKKWYKFHMHDFNQRASRSEYQQRRAARGMLFYPLAYSFVVLPLSVARWSLYEHHHIPTGAVFFAVSTWNLSGAVNVLLLVLIRPQLLLLTRPEVKVSVRVGIETERIVGTPKTPKSPDCPSFHSEASQIPLHPSMHCVVVAAPPPSHILP